MRLPVEYLHVSLVTEEAPSALRLWLELFDGKEPTNFATDEDGDTSARGAFEGYWIDLHRVGGGVSLYATRDERRSAHDRINHLEAEGLSDILGQLVKHAVSIGSKLQVERVGVNLVAGQPFEKASEAIAAYRQLGPAFALLPEGAVEARYEFTIPGSSARSQNARLRRGLQYRVGRRAVADPEGGYEAADGTAVRWQVQLGQVVTTNLRPLDSEYISGDTMFAYYDELVANVIQIWEAGAGEFA